jgi:uncharacterized membrane-anchored protein
MPIESSIHHPQRFKLSNELHARPFPELGTPCQAAYLSIKEPSDAAHRDTDKDRVHLYELLKHYGAPIPADDVNHYYGPLGKAMLKWERHTEFVSYTIYTIGKNGDGFDDSLFKLFPAQWINNAPGKILTSCLVKIEAIDSVPSFQSKLDNHIQGWFVPESLAASRVTDDNAIICGDFRIDETGHIRFAILANKGTSARRLGRIMQRLLEIETYKSMAMLTLPGARRISERVSLLETELAELVQAMAQTNDSETSTLDQLLTISAEVEHMLATSAFRFSAATAYEAIVNQRIEVLREQSLQGKQLFSDFMMRRFDPAMRTCRSAEQRLMNLSGRAARASNLLRTRVDVAHSTQNQHIMQSMNKRAEMQLQLQETVEGLSVVAISYYAVNLLAYLLAPAASSFGVDKKILLAGLIIPVIGSVIFMLSRIKKRLKHSNTQNTSV